MKTKIFFLLVAIMFVFAPKTSFAAASETYYAKVESEDVYLCSTPSQNSTLFEIPKSYFVQVENIVDEYYKVTYKNISGYVLRTAVTLMDGTPVTPYASATFSLFVAYSLYSSASETTALTSLASGQTLTYYGTKSGTSVKSDNSVWYYCSVATESGTLFGYVYSGVTDHLTTISVNTENFSVLSDDVFTESDGTISSLSTGTKIMLIVAIAVPSVLILYFLIKPSRILSAGSATKKRKVQHRSKGKADYFEFNENELS